jgi:hypothetical protein
MAADLADYAEQHQLLNEDGWRRFKKIDGRKKKILRLFKQEVLAARKRSAQFMFGVQVPAIIGKQSSWMYEMATPNGKMLNN